MSSTLTFFNTKEDIGNRALDHCGQEHVTSFDDPNKAGRLLTSNYDKVRQAELRRNVWRFSIKRVALRANDVTTRQIVPAAYNVLTTYLPGSLVLYAGIIWYSMVPDNLGSIPGTTGSNWQNYFGAMTALPYDSTTAYFAGELVYKSVGDGTYAVFIALANSTSDDPATAQAYDATVSYKQDDIVVSAAINYISKVDLNLGHTPATSPTQWATTSLSNSRQWAKVNVTLSNQPLLYPIGTGPVTQQFTQNVYQLPYAYLRRAPQNPKAGGRTLWGAPTGLVYADWNPEGNFIVTSEARPILFRFGADVTDVSQFDPMFAEGLAARLAISICEPITQSRDKISVITGEYQKFMTEARTVNGIETGPEEPEEDDFITTRL
jgi:hypothetical protein